MTKDFLYNFISEYKYAVLATVSPTNTPESACVGIAVTPDLKIIFDTTSESRKYKNLLLNPAISFVIGCNNEETIQYEGIAKTVDPHTSNEILEIYFKVFPDGKERYEKWKNIACFYVTPKWIRFSDFNPSKLTIKEIKL